MTFTTLKLSGRLGQKFGKSHTLALDTKSPREAIQALCVLHPQFKQYLAVAHKQGIEFAIFRGADEENIGFHQLGEPAGNVIRIAAVPAGAKNGGILQTILGAALIVVGAIITAGSDGAGSPLGSALVESGIAMLAGGIVQLLSPQTKLNSNSNNGDQATSYVFSGAVNTSAQGNPVPLLYGRMNVGSAVISAGIDAEDYSSAQSNVPADPGAVTGVGGDNSAVAGAKGGASTHTPTEAANSLRSISYFRILDLIAEGEIVGLVNGLQSVFLNKTPVAASDGTLNFQNVTVIQRTGTQDQDYIQGFSDVENEISVSTELKSDTPWTVGLTNLDLSAIRITLSVNSLQEENTSNGDITGYTIQYAIDVSTDGGAFNTVLTSSFSGKTTDEYDRSHRIDLPAATQGWTVRVRRITANANSSTISDTTNVVSYTEIIDAKLRYPNSAIIAVIGDAQQFDNIPDRSYDMKGRIISVPSNYNPTTRAYTGTWDGTFQPAWTDNPAWVYYDMCTNNRFGLGNLISSAQVDKWNLYRIAQYCDQLVSDGKGGQEPRFTCNVYLQQQEDAYTVLQDLATIFRGVSYWAAGQVVASADMPDDPVYTYDTSNVVNGLFTYQSSARSDRFTTALVTWNDPSNFYAQANEYCQYQAGLNRYGINQTSIAAFGCTSQGQAQRLGNWNILTSNLETETVTFQVGLEGLMCAPGQIIRIVDHARAGLRQGGRVISGTTTVLTLDQAPGECAAGDTITLNMPDAATAGELPAIRSETRTVASIIGNIVTVTEEFSSAPSGNAVWSVDASDLQAQTYRVTIVAEDDDNTAKTFSITAVQHNASKFDAIDNGTAIQIPPISRIPTGVQLPPTDVLISGHVVTTQGIATNVMTISWKAPSNGASQYLVEWQKDSGQWNQAGYVSTTSIDISGIYTGSYVARVTAFSSGNDASVPAISAATQVQGKTGLPPSLTSLTATSQIFGIQLNWEFPEGAQDTSYTEIYFGASSNIADATQLGTFAYPTSAHTLNGLAAGASFFFWGRLVDKTGNIGPWYPVGAGVNGQASSDATDILAYLSGQIDKDQLAQDLFQQIDQSTLQLNPPSAGTLTTTADGSAGDWTTMPSAGFYTYSITQVTSNSALSQTISQNAAAIGSTNAIVQTQSTAIDNINGTISSSFNIKTQIAANGQTYMAGIAVGVDQSGGTITSEVLVDADTFAVFDSTDASGSAIAPFIIQKGQVFISQALIGSGWITNAMIGNTIQSTSTNSAGSPTWIIDKAGTITLNGEGWEIVHSATGMVMTDTTTNVKVVQLGVLS